MIESKGKPIILFVEDDLSLQKSISYILEQEGFNVISSRTGEDAVELAKKERPDLVLLDLMLPGIDGFEVCELLKKNSQTEKIFIIMLTGKGMVDEIVRGLELYADDYITKPFEPKVLIARISGKKIDLTKTEFDIIALLARRPNQVFTRARILDHVRGDNYPITERVVDYQVSGLRKKLGKVGDYIKTVRGVGYKLET
jgi:two-component system alkaline phosphatase synthesis response regulator PhoP